MKNLLFELAYFKILYVPTGFVTGFSHPLLKTGKRVENFLSSPSFLRTSLAHRRINGYL